MGASRTALSTLIIGALLEFQNNWGVPPLS
jgi:hypothetical protein